MKEQRKIPDIRKVRDYFLTNTATMRQCNHDLGINKNSLCWYFDKLQREGTIVVIERRSTGKKGRYCKVYGSTHGLHRLGDILPYCIDRIRKENTHGDK